MKATANCFECGQKAVRRHHVVPRVRGGRKTIPLCDICHMKIHSLTSLDTIYLTSFALARKRANNEKTGGHVPYGWRLDADGKHLVEDAHEQKAVRLIRDRREKGCTLRAICLELEAEGYRTKTGKRTWQPKVVKFILRIKRRRHNELLRMRPMRRRTPQG